MPKKTVQPSLFDARVAALDEQQQAILHRLGLEALPSHETRWLAVERILLPEEGKVRVPQSLVQSIKRFGVLQAPSVVRCSPPEVAQEGAMYTVIAGRRRTRAARLAGLAVLKVEAYDFSTPQLSALLALMENTQRSAAWVKEVADLSLLIDQRVGMTIKELVACGFAKAGLNERLKIAQLPAPLLTQILAGKVSLETARKLARLTGEQLACVIQAMQEEPLTADLVKQALRVQITSTLAPAQIALPTWETLPTRSTTDLHLVAEEPSVDALLTALHAFTQSEAYHQREEARILVQALIQRLEIVAREQEQPAQAALAS